MARNERFTIDCDPAGPGLTAAYLRVSGGECAFVETHTSHALPRLLDALRDAGLAPGDVRWIIVTHAHLDHAAGASALMAACPNAQLLAHPRAARHLKEPAKLVAGATAVYGEARFRALYGRIDPIASSRVRALGDGEAVALGDAELRVLHTAGHANHHLAVHDPGLDTIYTGDTFGLVYPALQRRGLFVLPSTSPSNFDAREAKASVARVLALGTATACPTHFGETKAVREVGERLVPWIERADAWLEDGLARGESTPEMTARLALAWRDAIVAESETRGLGFGADELRLLALDIELNAQGLATVAEARRPRA